MQLTIDQQQKIRTTEVTWANGAWYYRDSTVISRDDWHQVTTQSRPHFTSNGVYRSILADDSADRTIAEVLEHYRSRNLPFRWTVGPSSRPPDLEQRLLAHGMTPLFEAAGMVIRTDAAMPQASPGVSVEIATPGTLDDWVTASMGGWGIAEQYRDGYTSDMREQMELCGPAASFVFARVGGEPAGAGIVQMVQGIGWLKGTSVRPEFRSRGVYTALVAHRLAQLQQAGVPWAAIQAVIDTSAPICRRLGFEEVCRIKLFVWKPEQKQV